MEQLENMPDMRTWIRSRRRTGFPDTLENLDVTFSWAAFLQSVIRTQCNMQAAEGLEEMLNMPVLPGIFLTGAAGTGKHTLASAVAGELEQIYFYECIYLTGAFLNALSPEQLLAYTKQLFEMYPLSGEDEELSLCLWVEDLSSCRLRELFADALTEQLEHLRREGILSETCFVILLDEKEQMVPAGLKRLLMRCECRLPDVQTRKLWFEQHMQTEKASFAVRGMNAEQFAAETEGMSFRELSDLMFYIKTRVCNRTLENVHAIMEEHGLATWDFQEDDRPHNKLNDQIAHSSFTPSAMEVREIISMIRRGERSENTAAQPELVNVLQTLVRTLEENQKASAGLAVTPGQQMNALQRNGAVISPAANASGNMVNLSGNMVNPFVNASGNRVNVSGAQGNVPGMVNASGAAGEILTADGGQTLPDGTEESHQMRLYREEAERIEKINLQDPAQLDAFLNEMLQN